MHSPGFETRQRLAATVDVRTLNYSKFHGKVFFNEWIERVRVLPGVESVSLASHLPLETTSMGLAVSIPGYEPPRGQHEIDIAVADVGSDYFKTMGIPLLEGREFIRQDTEGSQLVVIINEAMAERFWPGRDPTGLSLTIGDLASGQRYQIIGVAKTGRYQTLSENPQPFMYRSILQHYHPKATLIAHTPAARFHFWPQYVESCRPLIQTSC
jgi:putative ABC transport system permease protein